MNKKLLTEGLKKLNIEINEEKEKKFSLYSALLKEWNEKMNLTAVTDDDGISIKHFLDSALVLRDINFENKNIIDIGTGAGFPGIPLKILKENIKITLLDSLNKRIMFLNEVKEKLGLKNIETLHQRAEELGKNKNYREKYDIAISRAVANLKVLSEYALPFVKKDGLFIALKSTDIDEEIEESRAMIGLLGGKLREIIEIDIPFSDIKRKIVIIEKIKNTPNEFPRSNKKIKGSK